MGESTNGVQLAVGRDSSRLNQESHAPAIAFLRVLLRLSADGLCAGMGPPTGSCLDFGLAGWRLTTDHYERRERENRWGLAPDPCFLYHRAGTGAPPLRCYTKLIFSWPDAICCHQTIPLTLRSHSKKPLQPGHPKRPSDHAIAHSAQGHLATHIHLATHLAGQRMSSYYKSDLRCAEHPSAHESGIFCFLFFPVKKKEVAARRRHRRSQRIKGNKRRLRTKRLRQATHDPYKSLFLIHP